MLDALSTHQEKTRLLDKLIPDLDPRSNDYLFRAFKLKKEDFGYPRAKKGLGLDQDRPIIADAFLQPIISAIGLLTRTLGVQQKALSMFYPKNGFIGWHHNGNAPGYNILFSYSLDGDGCFKYYDHSTKEIVTMPDNKGWNVKVGYYPSMVKEPQRIYWHEAETKQPRLSIAYIVNQRDIWKSMIRDVTQGDYDEEFILNQGPVDCLKLNGEPA